jgi:hypothetical protein
MCLYLERLEAAVSVHRHVNSVTRLARVPGTSPLTQAITPLICTLPVVAAELVVEGEEAVEVAALGVEGGLGLARQFGHEVEGRQVSRAGFGGFDRGRNAMG